MAGLIDTINAHVELWNGITHHGCSCGWRPTGWERADRARWREHVTDVIGAQITAIMHMAVTS